MSEGIKKARLIRALVAAEIVVSWVSIPGGGLLRLDPSNLYDRRRATKADLKGRVGEVPQFLRRCQQVRRSLKIARPRKARNLRRDRTRESLQTRF